MALLHNPSFENGTAYWNLINDAGNMQAGPPLPSPACLPSLARKSGSFRHIIRMPPQAKR